MKKKSMYAGIAALAIGILFLLFDFTYIGARFDGLFPTNVHIYPVFFFLLVGLVLIFQGVKQSLKREE